MEVALDLDIPAEDLDRAAAALEQMESAFRPLVRRIPLETEPALIVPRSEEDSE